MKHYIWTLITGLLTVSSLGFSAPAQAAPGDLDPSFGTAGKVITDVGNKKNAANSVAIQPDGKIVIAGVSNPVSLTNPDDILVARYNPDGTLDGSFGNEGVSTFKVAGHPSAANAVAIQEDGKIVVVGSVFNGSNYDFAIARLTLDGTLDADFGSGGVVASPHGSGNDFAYAVAIQDDERIVVAGSAHNGSNDDFALQRFTTSGQLDSSFNGAGKVTTEMAGFPNTAFSIAIQPDGKIVAAGRMYNESFHTYEFAVARYRRSGAIDKVPLSPQPGETYFAVWGYTTVRFDTRAEAYAVGVQPDGKILMAGFSGNYPPGGSRDVALARLNADGSVDTTFKPFTFFCGTWPLPPCPPAGHASTNFGGDDDSTGMVLLPDGKILVAGTSNKEGTYDFLLSRFLENGAINPLVPDPLVGIITNLGSGEDRAKGITLDSYGRIVLAGYSHNGSNFDVALARYLDKSSDIEVRMTGSPDPVTVGTELTYTITVQSNGPDDAIRVDLEDSLPSGLTFVSASPSQGSCTGDTAILCDLGPMTNGASVQVAVVVRPSAPGTVVNTATAKGSDPNIINNTATVTTTVVEAPSDGSTTPPSGGGGTPPSGGGTPPSGGDTPPSGDGTSGGGYTPPSDTTNPVVDNPPKPGTSGSGTTIDGRPTSAEGGGGCGCRITEETTDSDTIFLGLACALGLLVLLKIIARKVSNL